MGSTALGLAYVFGMVLPLFLMALFWDRARLGERRVFQAKPVKLRVVGRTIDTNTINVVVAIAFAVMGAFVLFLAANGNTTVAPSFQLSIGRWLSNVFARVVAFLDPVPQSILGLALLSLAAVFVLLGVRGRRGPIEGGPCHVNEQDGTEADAEAGGGDITATVADEPTPTRR